MRSLNLLSFLLLLTFIYSCNKDSNSKVVSDPQPDGQSTPFSPNLYLGANHACAHLSATNLRCWGDNSWGQLGNESTASSGLPNAISQITTNYSIKELALGHSFSCLLTTAGGVKCWGLNGSGQLGNGTTTSSLNLTPVDVIGLTEGVTKISAYHNYSCALLESGAVKCWGENDYGQLGDGSTTRRSTPVEVIGLSSGVADISVGGYHACAVLTTGAVKCWGSNMTGQLGNGLTTNSSTPVDVQGLSNVASVAPSGFRTCALLTTGGVKCWGEVVGDGTDDNRSVPTDVVGLSSGVTAISSVWKNTCALLSNGGLKCWGAANAGELGDGERSSYTNVPQDVPGLTSGVLKMKSSSNTRCVFHGDYTTVKCWGENPGIYEDGQGVYSPTEVLF